MVLVSEKNTLLFFVTLEEGDQTGVFFKNESFPNKPGSASEQGLTGSIYCISVGICEQGLILLKD